MIVIRCVDPGVLHCRTKSL